LFVARIAPGSVANTIVTDTDAKQKEKERDNQHHAEPDKVIVTVHLCFSPKNSSTTSQQQLGANSTASQQQVQVYLIFRV
jgi:hypothetical protein